LLLPLLGPEAFSTWSEWAKYAHNYLGKDERNRRGPRDPPVPRGRAERTAKLMPKSPRFPKLDPNAKRSKRNRITFLSAETYQLLRAEGFDFEDISVVLAVATAALRDITRRYAIPRVARSPPTISAGSLWRSSRDRLRGEHERARPLPAIHQGTAATTRT